ncbi:MAG: hypothetical protein ABI867_13595 [Kofleriaceae bacterium]
MFARWLIVVGITLGCSSDKTAPTPASGSASTESPKVAPTVPAPPILPPRPPKPSADATFVAEPRDDVWAPRAEAELRERFKQVRGAKLQETECHQTLCKLVLAGSTGDVQQAIADLEGHRGLHGYAKNILLTAPDKQSDGTLVLRAYAMFDR